MNKTLQKVLIGLGIAAGMVGLTFGGLTLYKNATAKPVDVYPLTMIAETGYDYLASYAYGNVTVRGMQKVYASDSLVITEVLVAPGDTVHAGDPLATCNADLAGLAVRKAEVALAKLELSKTQAEGDLATLQSMRPYSQTLVVPEGTVEYTPHATPYLITGAGSREDPLVVLWDSNDVLTSDYLAWLVDRRSVTPVDPQPGEGGEGSEGGGTGTGTDPADPDSDPDPAPVDDGTTYLAFIVRESNALNAPILQRFGLRIFADETTGALQGASFWQPRLSAEIEAYDEQPYPYYISSGSGYTAAELARLRSEKELEIRKLDLEIRTARLDLENMQQEAADGIIRAKEDGVVRSVSDPENTPAGRPVIEVFAGGGYYVEATLSEYDINAVHVGQTVQVMVYDWQKGQKQVEGTVYEVGTYPVQSRYYDGSNVSWYPFTVFIDGAEDIAEGTYVEMTYNDTPDGQALFVPYAFIRTEGGRSFVYVLGEDGRLEERDVRLGADLWGYYTQVKGGLSVDDYIAFPYGKNVADGAKANPTDDMSSLYGGYF